MLVFPHHNLQRPLGAPDPVVGSPVVVPVSFGRYGDALTQPPGIIVLPRSKSLISLCYPIVASPLCLHDNEMLFVSPVSGYDVMADWYISMLCSQCVVLPPSGNKAQQKKKRKNV